MNEPPPPYVLGRSLCRRIQAAIPLALIGLSTPIGLASASDLIGPDVTVTTGRDRVNSPSLAISGNFAVLAWSKFGFSRAAWSLSTDGGTTWSAERSFPLGSHFDIVQGPPVVCSGTDRRFHAVVRCRSLSDQWFLAVLTGDTSSGDVVWSFAGFPTQGLEAIDASNYSIMADPTLPYVYLTYTLIEQFNDYLGYIRYRHWIVFRRSTDDGATWSDGLVLAPANCTGARLGVLRDGSVCVTWQNLQTASVYLVRSTDFGQTFTEPRFVANIGDNVGMIPPGWQPSVFSIIPYFGVTAPASFPNLSIYHGPDSDVLHLTWAEMAGGGRLPAGTALGEVEPNDDYEHATPMTIGSYVIGYEESADLSRGDCDFFTFEGIAGTTIAIWGNVQFAVFPQRDAGVALECQGSDGVTMLGVAILDPIEPKPPLVFTLPHDGTYYLVVSCSGAASIQYLVGLSEYERVPTAALDHRDVVSISSSDGGQTWSGKVRVNDSPPRFDDALPATAVDGRGRLHVAWYDRRADDECATSVQTYWAVSDGSGFAASQPLSSSLSLARTTPDGSGGWPVGPYMAMAGAADRVIAAWVEVTDTTTAIHAAAVVSNTVTGVLVSRFTAEPSGSTVRLSWRVEGAGEIIGFLVSRARSQEGPFMAIQEEPFGISESGNYAVEDAPGPGSGEWFYRLEVVLRNGSRQWIGPIRVLLADGVTAASLRFLGPNPFRSVLRFSLVAPRPGAARVAIYDVAGHAIAVPFRGRIPAGETPVVWEGRDHHGERIQPGIYMVKAEIDRMSMTRRIVCLR